MQKPYEILMGPYASYEDLARVEYGRLLWGRPHVRERLLRHWTDPRHPYAERFQSTYRPFVERLLSGGDGRDFELDVQLQEQGLSFRVVAREIPPVFGSFY
jgi:hypothetical protein